MRDLADLMDPALHLPIGGVDYTVNCTAHQGLHLTRLFADGIRLDDKQERAEIEQMLGDTYRQMVADKVPWAKIVAAGRTAMFHFGHSPAAGEAIWNSGGLPGNPAPPKPKRRELRKLRGTAAASENAAVA